MAIVANMGRRAASGCTVVARLVVDHVTETELWVHALDSWARAEIGSPVFRNGRLVAIVVALPRESMEGLRTLRIEAIVDRLKKRMQLEDAFDVAPRVRYNSDGHAAISVPAAVSASVLNDERCEVTEWTALDQVRRSLAQKLTQGSVTSRETSRAEHTRGGSRGAEERSGNDRGRSATTAIAPLLLGLALAAALILKSGRK